MPFDIADFTPAQNDLQRIKKARDAIANPDRWCKYTLGDNDQHCAIGWLIKYCDNAPMPWCYPRIVKEYFTPILISMLRTRMIEILSDSDAIAVLTSFNDHPKTKHSDVVALFDRVIEKF